MADIHHTTPETRFDSFHSHTVPYKHINSQTIDAHILIPKNIKPGPHPVFVKFHGGGLITGSAFFPDWFSNYVVAFAHNANCITVLPNYRLVPEHSGDDILEDLKDFWAWYDRDLKNVVEALDPSVDLNTEKLLVSGESSGGWTALHSVFMLPSGKARALLTQYPMLKRLPDDERPFPIKERAHLIPLLEEHMKSVQPGTVVSQAMPPARSDLCDALAVNYDRWEQYFGTGAHLHPMEVLSSAKYFPPTLILHGQQDDNVSLEECREFVAKVGTVLGKQVGDEVRLVERPGDHSFDADFVIGEEPWLEEQLDWITGKWLA